MKLAGMNESFNDSDGSAVVIYFQGCKRQCEGCQNPELWDKSGGFELDDKAVFEYLIKLMDWVDNVVFQGGEALDQTEEVIKIAKWSKKKGKSVWLYTGFLFDEVPQEVKELVDVIIDGPYVEEQRTTELPFRGSSNQRLWKKVDGKWSEKIQKIGDKQVDNKKTLYVGNISWGTTEEQLKAAFETIGSVFSARIITDRVTGRSRGFGFVEMEEAEAPTAIEKMNGFDMDGRPLIVNEARPKEPKV